MASKRTLKPVDLNFDEPGKDLSRLFAASLASEPEVHQAQMVAVDIDPLLLELGRTHAPDAARYVEDRDVTLAEAERFAHGLDRAPHAFGRRQRVKAVEHEQAGE